MIAQRVGVAALRRGAAQPNVFFSQNIAKAALAAGMSTTSTRPASVGTTKLSNDEGHQILVKQRLNRPISPHLGIYKLEQTWFGSSAWNRITGCAVSGVMYAYMASYLAAPLLGWHFESASVAAAVGGLPLALKGGLKFGLAFPFAYHCINGVKHLFYDLGKGFAKKTIVKADLYLWAASFIAAGGLAFGL